jgi:hypothetical protein
MRYIVLEQFSGVIGGRSFFLKPGTIIDDAQHDVASYLKSGAPLIRADSCLEGARTAFNESGQGSMLSRLFSNGDAPLTPNNTISVGGGGTRHTSLQSALDEGEERVAAGHGPQTVLAYTATFDEQIVVPDFVGIRGMGSANESVLIRSSDAGAVVTLPSGSGTVLRDVTIQCGGSCRALDVPGAAGQLFFIDGCLMVWAGLDMASEIIRMSGLGNLIITTSQMIYNETHSVGASAPHRGIHCTAAASVRISNSLIQMNVADPTQPTYAVHMDVPTGSPDFLLISSQVQPTTVGDCSVLFFDSNGSSRVSGSQIEASGAAGADGEAIKTGGHGVTVDLTANHVEVGGYDLNFYTNVDTGDVVSSQFDDIDVDQGSRGSGAFTLSSSQQPGQFETAEVVARSYRAVVEAGGLTPGEITDVIQTIINEAGSTGGEVHVLDGSIGANTGLAEIYMIRSSEGVNPILQRLGVAAALGKAWLETSLSVWTDVTSDFNSGASNVPIVPGDDDRIYVGSSALFNGANFQLDTPANVDAFLTFEYWNGAGWIPFSASDATGGFVNSGEIRWDASALTGWATTQVNSEVDGPWYYVRITRTRNNLAVDPIETTVQVIPATELEFFWDKTANIKCATLEATARLQPRTVNDAGMTSTDGTAPEIVYNAADSTYYGCTVTGSPATWVAF